MHCMDADFSVFAILPPYNTIQAQGGLMPLPQVVRADGASPPSVSEGRFVYVGFLMVSAGRMPAG